MGPPDPKAPPQAIASYWVSQITTGSLLMVLPAAGGWWLDQKLRTSPGLLVTGALFGSVLSFLHLLVITGVIKQKPRS